MFAVQPLGLSPADVTGIATVVVAVLGLPAAYLGLRRSQRHDDADSTDSRDAVDARWRGFVRSQDALIADLRTELATSEHRCQERLDEQERAHRREVVALRSAAARQLTDTRNYITSLERRILDLTIGGLSQDLANELDEHAAKLRQAQRDFGLTDDADPED